MMRRVYFLFAVALTFIPLLTFAQGYVPLEPLPQLGSNPTFAQYLKVAFNLSLLAGAALAVLMLTIGGVQYMTSDALGQKEAGRARIKNAVLGFLLLLSVYVILETINPNLLTFNLVLQKVGTEYDPVKSGPTQNAQEAKSSDGTTITILRTTNSTSGYYFTNKDGQQVAFPYIVTARSNANAIKGQCENEYNKRVKNGESLNGGCKLYSTQ